MVEVTKTMTTQQTKTDCFAYRGKRMCSVLSELVCKNRNCSFYKTKEKHKIDCDKYGYFPGKK